MPIADYSHWNEEAERVWWEEEGRHSDEPPYDPDDYLPASNEAADAFAEECAERSETSLLRDLCDADYRRRWPKAVPIIQAELTCRGIGLDFTAWPYA
jgi:hypothetical protein